MAEIVEVESSGITCEVDKARLADQRFMHCLSKVSDPQVPENEKLVWYSRMLDVALGGDAYGVMCMLADANGGTCGMETFGAFFNDVLEQVGAKNS